jgi:hypothetical protein
MTHPAGPVHVMKSPDLDDVVTVNVGAEHLDRLSSLAVDIVWQPQPAGLVVSGSLSVAAIGELKVFGCYATDQYGELALDARGCQHFVAALQARAPANSPVSRS